MNLFVGRADELKTSLRLLTTPNDGIVQDIVGIHGIGKSMFLEQLSHEARELANVEVFNIDMKRHGLGEGFAGDLGATATSAVLWEVFTRSRELMGLFAEQLSSEFDAFREVSRYQGLEADRYLAKNDITLGRRSQIGKAEFTTILHQGDDAVKQRIRESQLQIDDAFITAWAEFTVRRRALITFDNFQLVADNEMGQWIIRIVTRMPNTLAVLARTPSGHLTQPRLTSVKSTYLTLFTFDEVADFLSQRFPDETLSPELAAITHAFTDGHPGGVNLVADLIFEKGGGDLEPASLRRLLDSLPTDEDQRWAELVLLILEAIHEPRLRRAVEAAAVATTFDGALLAELIDAADPHGVEVGEIISKLVGIRMLQQIRTISGGLSDRFRLHEFIRLSVVSRLRRYDPGGWLDFHSVAAQHYFRLVKGTEDEPYDSYGAWYRFEDPEWQENKREWLWHSGMATAAGRRTITRARFTLVFLEAFWWWGYYAPFPFMRRLLEDWSRAAAEWARARVIAPVPLGSGQDQDELLLDTLTNLLNGYPVGHLKPSGAPWDDLRDSLLLLRSICGLQQGGMRHASAEEKTDMKRADAFITLFLAHTRRFRDPADPRAEKYYEDAARSIGELADSWTGAWIFYERADLALERGDLVQAAERIATGAAATRALAVETQEWDHELLGNMHRAWADVCWLNGRLEDAALGYGRSVAHAYWFQGEPHAPDEYTQQFYVEMTTRTAERIVELADRPADMERFVSGVRRQIPGDSTGQPAASLIGSDVTAIREMIFPPGPATSELRMANSPFMIRWNALNLDRADPLDGLDYLRRINDQ